MGQDEVQTTGPNSLAMLPDGSFVVAYPLDNCLLRYIAEGTLFANVDLYVLYIMNVSGLTGTPTELYLLEISFNLAREC
jgi:hypothetical protein